MKKIMLFLVCLFILTPHVLTIAERKETIVSPSSFISHWHDEENEIVIWQSDGNYYVSIERYDHGYEHTEWYYTCSYDETNEVLVAEGTGLKSIYIYDEDLDQEYLSNEFTGRSAIFLIRDGYLIWIDQEENAGKDLSFRNLGNYEGKWESGNTTIEFYIIDGFYRCFIDRKEKDDIVIHWEYFCTYDAEDNHLVSDSLGLKEIYYSADDEDEEEEAIEVYHDGSAVFSINNNGDLLWNDLKDNEGDGCLFQLVEIQEDWS